MILDPQHFIIAITVVVVGVVLYLKMRGATDAATPADLEAARAECRALADQLASALSRQGATLARIVAQGDASQAALNALLMRPTNKGAEQKGAGEDQQRGEGGHG